MNLKLIKSPSMRSDNEMATSEESGITADLARAAKRMAEMVKSDAQIASLVPDDQVTAAIKEPGLSYQQVIDTVLTGYAARAALGVRSYEVREGTRHYLPKFSTISYGQLSTQVKAMSSAFRHDPRFRVDRNDFVVCISFTGAEMTAVDFACVYSQAISVPVQANLGSAEMLEILEDVAPVMMVASIDNLDIAIDYVLKQNTIRSVMVIDADTRVGEDREGIENARAMLLQAGRPVTFATFSEVLEAGASYKWTPLPRHPEGNEALSMIMYTSGSTGTPKGAQIHEAYVLQYWTELSRYQPTVSVVCTPMNHWMGRNGVTLPLVQGGTCYYSLKSDLSTLIEDIRLVRPTYNQFLPRFAEIIYQNYLSEVHSRVANGTDTHEAHAQVRAEMRHSYLGNRLLVGAIGSSPTAPEVTQFLRECFDIALIEGYGSTEASGSATTVNDRVRRELVIDYKLRDVPELGYYTTDKPCPRGELVSKTRHQFKGYFKKPEATAKVFDEDGYVLTGDIMEERSPDHLVWLDRCNNVIKLSQAEYVAIGPLETSFVADNPMIKQIYVYGNSYRAFLLAVVVPNIDCARDLLGHGPSDEELRILALEHLQARARIATMKSFEIPRDVLIEREPFTLENGLLSSVRKPLRPNLKRRYEDKLEAMYREMDCKQQEELAQLRTGGTELPTGERVAAAFKASLGLPNLDHSDFQSYRDLGGDSLGAVGLSMLVKDMFGVSVPVSIILDPAGSTKRLAQYIDHAVAEGGSAPSFDSVHGEGTTSVRASDLVLPAFVDADTLEAVAQIRPPAEKTRTVLLTGATGFLGRFLLLEWMEKLSARDGKVIAIIRAQDVAAARARLDKVIGTLDPELARLYQTLAGKHLEVIPGDLVASKLGQTNEEFSRLAHEVDQIVHPGALVNHRLTYQNLFEPNVIGSAELIRLALTQRQKRFDYISTVAVPELNPRLRAAVEDVDVRSYAPEMPLGDAYALGYGTSKWAGEVLLRDAHERFGLPVTVFRPNMILAHSRYIGQINVPDMFTRLLFSIVATGIAPGSFYQPEDDGSRARAHYDGMPVDILAAAMRKIGDQPYTGFSTYNTINMHHEDGISLDSYVDWVETAGYPVHRVANHADWFRRFGDKLRNLPEEERQRSSLQILAFFTQPHEPHPAQIKTDRFEAAVGAREIPHITEAFIHKFLADMRALTLISPPACSAAQTAS